MSNISENVRKADAFWVQSADPKLFNLLRLFTIGFCFVAITGIFTSALFVAGRSFPLTDGWYESLIFLHKKGRNIYEDIEFLFPPMIYWFFSFIDFVLGPQILSHRLAGLLLNLMNTFLVFWWLRLFLPTQAALIGSVFYAGLTLTGVVYIALDYHNFLDFCSLLFLISTSYAARLARTRISGTSAVAFFLSGLTLAAVFLTKQNVGTVLFLFAFLILFGFILYFGATRSSVIPSIGAYFLIFCCGFFLAIGLATYAIQGDFAIGQFLLKFISVEAKGGLAQIMFRFVLDIHNRILLLQGIAIAFLSVLIQNFSHLLQTLYVKNIINDRFHERSALWISRVKFHAQTILVVCAIPLLFFPGQSGRLITLFAIASLARDAFKFVGKLFSDGDVNQEQFIRIMIFGAFLYSNALTSSFNEVGTLFISIFYVAKLFDYFEVSGAGLKVAIQVSNRVLLGAIVSLLIAKALLHKIIRPYEWWGMAEPSTLTSRSLIEHGPLAGFKLPDSRAEILKQIERFVSQNTNQNDPILAFPHMPIIYILTDRSPSGRTFVQWYDFVSNKALAADLIQLINYPPKVVIAMSLPDFVRKGHAKLIGRPFLQDIYYQFLDCMIQADGYQKERDIPYNSNWSSVLPIQYEIIFNRELTKKERLDFLREHGSRLSTADIVVDSANAFLERWIVTTSPEKMIAFNEKAAMAESQAELRVLPYSLRLLKRGQLDSDAVRDCKSVSVQNIADFMRSF